MAWSPARARVVCRIPGTFSLAHLEENVAAATLQLTDDQVAKLTATAHTTVAVDNQA
ncbi:aldo/keto reductase [Actinomadura rugatobispora]|uniref:Aldo/keto reductase n=1 Tax=Actinomadura rugatobispora TaxID=1994 RepID=A0ABW1A066_9ACTN